jgi:hypothetical protein
MTIYKWKEGTRANVSAQDAGEVCAALEAQGNLTPAALVDASRPEDAPLHRAFVWDDAVAAEKYREVQAGHIIRCIEVEITSESAPTRAFVPVIVQPEARGYSSIESVLVVKDAREELLARAYDELAAFERKYRNLSELAGVFAAIKALGVRHGA